ncbi:ATP-binding protein [Wenjunlia tyrosinilytica]|uniref:ATPase n=1 Tax=Wenjunlia tyrosinilytica TaxID=1544741 RepID=A0A917ZPG8_9ACTN|nr:ATP-binding protein [Wenjunlia tyrosinilytica]GGO88172.1 ATPase [Wenjunlia tyrosinilytica]
MSTTRPFVPDDRGSSEAGDSVGPASGQVRRVRLAGASGVVALARDFTRKALYDWGWLPAASEEARASAEDVLLVVSELVTNACLHADGADALSVQRTPETIRLEVTDSGEGRPEPKTPHRGSRPGGHGMYIVQRLCVDWGMARDAEGGNKTVWAEIAAPSLP